MYNNNNTYNMEEYVWTYGEKPEKSYKKNPENITAFASAEPAFASAEPAFASVEPAFASAEPAFESAPLDIHMTEYRISNNKRELANNKLNDRELIGQVGQNPFNTSNNYLNDLEVQQNFLIPRPTNNTDMFSK
jgi:hypothetical protein